MVEGLKVQTDKKAAAEQIKGLYRLFVEKDCTMVEVGSWAAWGGLRPVLPASVLLPAPPVLPVPLLLPALHDQRR